jgi:hypothetical protein
MHAFIGRGLLTLLAVLTASQANPGPSGSARSPAEEYQSLVKEHQRASSAGIALSDEERLRFVGQTFRLRNQLALKLIELAEKHPRDPVAVDALLQAVWQVNTTPWPVEIVGTDDAPPRAFALLERDHIESDKLGPTCLRISYGFRREYESFLRATLAKTPHRQMRGQACLALGRFLSNRRRRLDLIAEQPQLANQFADLFGKEYLEDLRRQDPGQADREAEGFFERAANEFADVKLPDGGTVGDRATIELFELRHLVVGKTAPDIEGVDQDGQRFKLSDYRGKVTLLDFWSEY